MFVKAIFSRKKRKQLHIGPFWAFSLIWIWVESWNEAVEGWWSRGWCCCCPEVHWEWKLWFTRFRGRRFFRPDLCRLRSARRCCRQSFIVLQHVWIEYANIKRVIYWDRRRRLIDEAEVRFLLFGLQRTWERPRMNPASLHTYIIDAVFDGRHDDEAAVLEMASRPVSFRRD